MRLLLVGLIAFISGASAQHLPAHEASIPLVFEPNRGQAPPSVKFLSRGSGYQALLTEKELVLVVQRNPEANSAKPTNPAILRLRWLGADSGAHFYGQQRLASYSNYFLGPDQRQWQTKVPHFASAMQANAKLGLNLQFYATSRQQLEYDLSLSSTLDAWQVGSGCWSGQCSSGQQRGPGPADRRRRVSAARPACLRVAGRTSPRARCTLRSANGELGQVFR